MVATTKDTIPQGRYDARIVRSQFNAVATGDRLDLDFEIIGGQYDGCIIVKGLHLHSSNTNTKLKARAELSRICVAVRVMAPKDTSELHDIPMVINVGVNKRCNTILVYSPSPKTLQVSQSSLSENDSAPSPQRGLKLTRADRIEIRPPDWLLRGMLERDTFALVFGDPGSGKSFLAIDWACRIATGTPWRGHGVKPAPVVYVAGEGHNGLGRRIQAWQQSNERSLDGAPLYIAPAVALTDPNQLVGLVQAIEAETESPAMIVIDTLARCFGGGDENATKDMSAFVAACDALRQHYRCAMLVIHHAGHGDKSRARGAIALKAALDAEYRVEKTDGNQLLLTATKMKDAETPQPVAMQLTTVDLPDIVDEYGNPVTSAAIEVLDAETSAIVAKVMATRSGKRGKWQEVGLSIARRLIASGDDGQANIKDWHTECEAAGMRQSTRYDVLSKLHAQGTIVVDDNCIVTS